MLDAFRLRLAFAVFVINNMQSRIFGVLLCSASKGQIIFIPACVAINSTSCCPTNDCRNSIIIFQNC